jgi:uncharacterized protein with FMN-binding domain
MKEVKKRKRRLKMTVFLLSIVLVIVFIGIGAVIWDAPAREELKNTVIAEVNFRNLKDGVYTGEYRGTKNNLRDVAVEVTVEAGVVTKITVTEGAYAGDKGNDEIAKGFSIADLSEKVIESKSLHVDAISGATLTVNAYLEAVENALLKAQIN